MHPLLELGGGRGDKVYPQQRRARGPCGSRGNTTRRPARPAARRGGGGRAARPRGALRRRDRRRDLASGLASAWTGVGIDWRRRRLARGGCGGARAAWESPSGAGPIGSAVRRAVGGHGHGHGDDGRDGRPWAPWAAMGHEGTRAAAAGAPRPPPLRGRPPDWAAPRFGKSPLGAATGACLPLSAGRAGRGRWWDRRGGAGTSGGAATQRRTGPPPPAGQILCAPGGAGRGSIVVFCATSNVNRPYSSVVERITRIQQVT